jgi:uncharacterized protein YigE (DUF2233 family)
MPNTRRHTMRRALLAFLLLAGRLCAAASDQPFTVVRVDPAAESLQAFWGDEQGKPFGQFDRLATWLEGQGKRLTFAMNAGMYHRDFSPVGLMVIEGKQVSPLNTATGGGNFFLKPNGVFALGRSGPMIVETGEYPRVASGVRFATQSGPLLLRNGAIHPAFNAASTSRLIRNGVGTSGGVAYFVISEQPVTFHEMAVFFRDVLHCKDALYLDGVVSSLYSADLKREDRRADLGPIVGVVVDRRPGPSIGRASSTKPGDASNAR